MADGAFGDRAGIALQGDRLDVVARLPAGQDGVRAVVAGLAVQSAVPGGVAVERVRVFGVLWAVAGRIAAARLVYPGDAVLVAYVVHIAVTVRAPHPAL